MRIRFYRTEDSHVETIAIALLLLTLIILKATNVIDLPWVWVFSPLWVPFAAFGVFIFAFFAYLGIKNILDRL